MKISKVLIFLALIMFASAMFAWRLAQGEYVGGVISDRVSQMLQKQIPGSLKFERVELLLFPPGISIKEINFNIDLMPSYQVKARGELSEVMVRFDIIDFVFGKNTLSSIDLQGGVVIVDEIFGQKIGQINLDDFIDKSKTEPKSDDSGPIINPIFSKIKLIFDSLPFFVKKIGVKNLILTDQVTFHQLHEFVFENSKRVQSVLLEINNLPSIKFKDYFLNSLGRAKLQVSLYKNRLEVDEISISEGWSHLSLSAVVQEEETKGLEILSSKLDAKIRLEDQFFNFPENSKFIAQDFKGALEIKSSFEKEGGDFDLTIHDFSSPFLDIENGKIKFAKRDHALILEKSKLSIGKGMVETKEPVKVYDFKTEKLHIVNAKLEVEQLTLSEALKYLNAELDFLDLKATGQIDLSTDLETLTLSAPRNIGVENLKIKIKGKEDLLEMKKAQLEKFILNTTLAKDLYLTFSGILNEKGSNINLSGEVIKNQVEIKIPNSNINLTDIEKISGIKIGGDAFGDISIKGTTDNLDIKIDAKLRDFSLLGMYGGNAEASVFINTVEKEIKFNQFKSVFSRGTLEVGGSILLQGDGSYNLIISFDDLGFEDAQMLFEPFLSEVPYKENLFGSIDGKIKIFGGLNIYEMRMEGNIICPPFLFKSISFEGCEVGVSYHNEKFSFNLLSLRKSSGLISGNFNYDVNSKNQKYEFSWKGVPVRSFYRELPIPVGLNAYLSGEYKGGVKNGEEHKNAVMYATRAQVSGQRLGNSFLQYKKEKNIAKGRGFVFDNWVKFNFVEDYNEAAGSQQMNSMMDVQFKIEELRKALALISSHNLADTSIEGLVEASYFKKYNVNSNRIKMGNLTIEKFNLSRGRDNLSLLAPFKIPLDSQREIKNTAQLVGEKTNIKIHSLFDLEGNHLFRLTGDLNLSILELAHERILKSKGRGIHNLLISIRDGGVIVNGDVKLSDFAINIKGIPSTFEGLSIDAEIENNHLVVNKLNGAFGSGQIDGFGKIEFGVLPPSVNFNFGLNNSTLSLFEKSYATVSGRGGIIGTGYPYVLSGSFFAEEIKIKEEFDEFAKGNKAEQSFTKFRPAKAIESKQEEIIFDMKVSTSGGAHLKNSIADLYFSGSGTLLGGANNPKLDGHFVAIPQKSKFGFRGNDFFIQQGSIHFFGSEEEVNPEINFKSSSQISTYKVQMDVTGRAKSFEMGLKSEPPLTQRNIVTLLAVGYTGGEDLNEQDRGDIESAGLGTLLLDKFQFNEGLNSNFGLKVLVNPEVSSGQGNAIKSRVGGEGAADEGLYKSATKVTIKRDLGKSVDMSVSSTVGGSLGQKQEMNINYKMGKSVSLQMIYEVEEQVVEDSVGQSVSAGADLKFRWTFK